MKLFKKTIFSIFGAALLTTGFVACSSDDNSTTESTLTAETTNSTMSVKSNEDFEKVAMATVEDNDVVTPLYDEAKLKESLVSEGFYAEVESIELEYYFNNDTKKQEAFFTIVAKSKDDFMLEAFVADLVIDGGKIFMMNPNSAPTLFMNHKCKGSGCSSCDFTRDKWLKITGCKCAVKTTEGGSCDHTKTTGGPLDHHAIVKTISHSLQI